MKINSQKIIQDILSTEKFKELLREKLAEKITNEYYYSDVEGILIKEETRKLVKDEAKLIVEELVNSYYELDSIKDLVEETFKKLTRIEIIKLLENKL